jgi:hydroxypyruvate reductase
MREAVSSPSTGLSSRSHPVDVITAGKAAESMLRGFVSHGPPVARGVAAAPKGPPGDLPVPVEWVVAGHPSPDRGSERAGRLALALAAEARDEGRALVVLLSGGASSLLAVPADGVTLADKAVASSALMRAGVDIAGLNCVRKHLSAVKGGRLAAAAGASITFALSDVHGPIADDPSVIGSGPTVADPSTFGDALRIVRASGARVPAAVVRALERGARGETEDTPKPSDARLAEAHFFLVGNRRTAMAGATAAAESLGYRVVVVDEPLGGEARETGARFARESLARVSGTPLCVVATGETTVHVTGKGRGGRNQEFVLAAVETLAALAAEGGAALVASAGTDGIDGPTDAAGAVADSTTLERARDAGLDWRAALADNGAYDFFGPLGDLIVWGPTGTNVGDLAVLLVG